MNLAALLRSLQKQQPPLDGPVMGAPAPQSDGMLGGLLTQPPPAGGVLANALAQNPNKITPTTIADSIQSVTGWRPGTPPSWVPQSFVESNKASVAADQARQQELQQKYGFTPRDAEIAMGFSGPAAIEAFHGSPHSFDAFDLSKIGTGEGAQAYGHGLYFAENEGVARDYRNTLGGTGPKFEPSVDPKVAEVVAGRYEEMKKQGGGGYDVLKAFQNGDWYHPNDAINVAIKSGIDDGSISMAPQGSMYQVRINAEPEQFLHWDKPLAQQSPPVQEALQKLGLEPGKDFGTGSTGADVLSAIRNKFGKGYLPADKIGGDPMVSQKLSETGISGIRYLDQGSRDAADIPMLERNIAEHEKAISEAEAGIGSAVLPETVAHYKSQLEATKRELAAAQNPTHNYVVFSDKLIDILKKYGLAGLTAALGAGGLAAAAPGQAQASQPPELGR